MLKSLFGGSVVLTTTLLLSSLTYYAQTSSTAARKPANDQDCQAQTTSNSKPSATTHKNEAASADVISAASALPQTFTATAYALPGKTASGDKVRRGLIAADRSLPLGTRVRLNAGSYSGEYTVADRGSRVRGRTIDIWVPNNGEAVRFGRRPVKLTILSYGAKKPAKNARKTGS